MIPSTRTDLTVMLAAALTLLAAAGCSPPDLQQPLEGRVQVSLDLERLTRAGLFPRDLVSDDLAEWRVDPLQAGRIRGVWTSEEPTLVEIAPLVRATGPLGRLSFPWPDSPGPNHLLAMAWYDADDDGMLDLVSAGDAEVVRAFSRLETTRYYLTELNWVPELSHATGRAENAVGGVLPLDASRQDGWLATFSQAIEPPLE